MPTAEQVLLSALRETARYYGPRGGRAPKGFTRPKSNEAAGWTRAELSFLKDRLEQAGHVVKREREVENRLPPDLVVVEGDGRITVHLERETRGFEWNHVLGALLKMLLLPDPPAEVTFLVIANTEVANSGSGPNLNNVLDLSKKLLQRVRGVKRLYVAAWCGRSRWDDTRIFRLSSTGRMRDAIKKLRVFP